MGFSTKLRLIKEKFEQLSGDSLILSGNTEFADSADVRYTTHPTFVDDEQIVDKKYVDDHVQSGTTASLYYTGETPSNITVGGMDSGAVLTGRTLSNIIDDMTHTYYVPTFSAFNIGVSTGKEVGYVMPSTSNATWSTSHSENVKNNSINIVDVTGNVTLASGLANDGNETVNLTSKTFTPNGSTVQTYTWRIEGVNTNNNDMTDRNYSINVYQPWFYGKTTVSSRPTANQSLIDGYQSKKISNSSSTITANYGDDGSTTYWYWFAVPTSSSLKEGWFVDNTNKGEIGGTVGSGGNLFPDPDTINIDDPDGNWTGVDYRVYITNDKTRINGGTIDFTNSPQFRVLERIMEIEDLLSI